MWVTSTMRRNTLAITPYVPGIGYAVSNAISGGGAASGASDGPATDSAKNCPAPDKPPKEPKCSFWKEVYYGGLERDGVCYPVTHVLPTVPMLNHVETLRTGQHAPSGLGGKITGKLAKIDPITGKIVPNPLGFVVGASLYSGGLAECQTLTCDLDKDGLADEAFKNGMCSIGRN
jgi:hypothetical protein